MKFFKICPGTFGNYPSLSSSDKVLHNERVTLGQSLSLTYLTRVVRGTSRSIALFGPLRFSQFTKCPEAILRPRASGTAPAFCDDHALSCRQKRTPPHGGAAGLEGKIAPVETCTSLTFLTGEFFLVCQEFFTTNSAATLAKFLPHRNGTRCLAPPWRNYPLVSNTLPFFGFAKCARPQAVHDTGS